MVSIFILLTGMSVKDWKMLMILLLKVLRLCRACTSTVLHIRIRSYSSIRDKVGDNLSALYCQAFAFTSSAIKTTTWESHRRYAQTDYEHCTRLGSHFSRCTSHVALNLAR